MQMFVYLKNAENNSKMKVHTCCMQVGLNKLVSFKRSTEYLHCCTIIVLAVNKIHRMQLQELAMYLYSDDTITSPRCTGTTYNKVSYSIREMDE